MAAAVALSLLLAACSDDEDAGPRPEPRVTTSTALVDRSGIVLTPVGGETTTTIRETGAARLVGVVRGPAGPVAGATVRVERFVVGREVRTDVLTGPDGRWVLEGVPGGRYRVRAFLAPSLAQVEAEVRFLADRAEHEFDLTMEEHSGLVVRSSSAPAPAMVGSPVNLVVQVAQRRVDGDGIVRAAPVPGSSVELTGLGRWVVRDDGSTFPGQDREATARTDGEGRARWELRCEVAGDPGLAVRIPVTVSSPAPPAAGAQPDPQTATTSPGPQVRIETVALDVPACVEPAPTTTTHDGSTTTTADEDG